MKPERVGDLPCDLQHLSPAHHLGPLLVLRQRIHAFLCETDPPSAPEPSPEGTAPGSAFNGWIQDRH